MKKSVKAIIALCLVVVLAGSIFAACTAAKPEENKVYKVGVIQLLTHEALDAATEGFVAALKDKLGDNVDIEIQNGQEQYDNCVTIANQFVSKGVDLIMGNATPALQAAVAATGTIPIVGTSITEYGVALDKELVDGKTGMNVTGTADLAPLDQQAAMVKTICPNVKSVGIIYCSSEPNSKYQAEEVKKYLANDGIEGNIYTFENSNELSSITQKAVSENDALYVPTDNTAAKYTDIVDAVARPAKCPVFAGEEGICRGCGIVTLSIKYYDIGYQAGLMAAEILAEGKDPADMPIGYAPEFTPEYNPVICKELGINVPETYVALDVAE